MKHGGGFSGEIGCDTMQSAGKFGPLGSAAALHGGRDGGWRARGSQDRGGGRSLGFGRSHRGMPGGKGAQRGVHANAGSADGILEGFARERQGSAARQRPEQGGRDHAALRFGHGLHIGMDEAQGSGPGGVQDRGAVGPPIAGAGLFHNREAAVRGGDEGGFVGRDEAALNGAAGLHQFGGDDDIDISRHGHERQDGAGIALLGPDQFDIVDRRTRALGHAGHGGGLRDPAAMLREGDDPIGQHAAALPAHGHDGDGDGPVDALAVGVGVHASTRRPVSRRRCRNPITALRRRAFRRSHCVGLCTISAR